MKNFCEDLFFFFFFFFFGDRLKNFCEDLFFFFFGEHLRFVSLVLGLEHSCPWPRECLSSERLSLALASDFFCVLGLGLEPCVLDSTSVKNTKAHELSDRVCYKFSPNLDDRFGRDRLIVTDCDDTGGCVLSLLDICETQRSQ